MEGRRAVKRIGVLGGGQLSRMLVLHGAPLGYEMHVLSEHRSDPAAQVTGFHHQGSPAQLSNLKKFIKKIDFLTFESEFIDLDLLQLALNEAKTAPAVFPSVQNMAVLQDRRTQKILLEKFKIPTADFKIIEKPEDLIAAAEHFSYEGFVLKKSRGGYDGNGTFYIRKPSDIEKHQSNFTGTFIAEKLIPFQKELAIIAVCDAKNIAFLPLVETKQKDSRCDWVVGPCSHPKLAGLQKKLRNMLKKIKYRGVIAFELFATRTELLVNEVAPRVHNSGHYSQQALCFSQFDLHLLAGTGAAPTFELSDKQNFVMLNLIGESNQDFVFAKNCTGHLHWYGKTENRPGRKMGHLNWTGSASQKSLLAKALKERLGFKK